METRGPATGRMLRGLLWVLAMGAVMVVLLTAMNRLPLMIQPGAARYFDTIEEARRAAGMGAVAVPRYFPEGISWPPSLVLAQQRPYKALVMEFRRSGSKETIMTIIQSSAPEGAAQLQRTGMTAVKDDAEYALKGRRAVLRTGTCGKETPCSIMSWEDDGLHSTVLLLSTPLELIRIAESMVR